MKRVLPPLLLAFAACSCGPEPEPEEGWSIVFQDLPAGLVSVSGTSATDVWAAGGEPDDQSGPYVLHYDGASWKKHATGTHGDLWWIFPIPGGPVFIGGAGGTIVRYQNGAFEKMTTPGTATVYGIWGTSATDLWAVGGEGGSSAGFAWRYDGTSWTEAPGFPQELMSTATAFKVWGRSANDVYIVGSGGLTLHWDGAAFTTDASSTTRALFTVSGSAHRAAAVGGFSTGVIIENDGSGWKDVTPAGAPQLNGVALTSDDDGYAAGLGLQVYRRSSAGWASEGIDFRVVGDLHAVWVDPSGGVWAVGGQVLSLPLTDGVLIHKGPAIAATIN